MDAKSIKINELLFSYDRDNPSLVVTYRPIGKGVRSELVRLSGLDRIQSMKLVAFHQKKGDLISWVMSYVKQTQTRLSAQ